MSHGNQAVRFFEEGYNCAQSVAMSFAEEIGLEEKKIAKLVSSFGGGMGRMREVCGSVSGMYFVLGALYGYDDPNAYEEKKLLYEQVQYLAKEFKKETGSIICRELLGLEGKDTNPTPSQRTEHYYQKRPCKEMVRLAAELTEKFIEENPYA